VFLYRHWLRHIKHWQADCRPLDCVASSGVLSVRHLLPADYCEVFSRINDRLGSSIALYYTASVLIVSIAFATHYLKVNVPEDCCQQL